MKDDYKATARVPLMDGWTLWPLACLRGAGFPMGALDALAMPKTSALSSALITLEHDCAEAIERCLTSLRAAIETHEGKARKPYAKAIKKLRRGVIPEPAQSLPEAQTCLAQARSCELDVNTHAQRMNEAFAEEMKEVQLQLETAARDPRFREAVAWQNLNGLRTGVDKIASAGVKYQRLIANYLQRYCAKNDTIGFFGPVGWATVDHTKDSAVTPGRELLATRTVYFEHWAIEALCEQFSERSELLPHIVPRPVPNKYVEGTTLHHSRDREDRIPGELAKAVGACDGRRTGLEVAEVLAQRDVVDSPDEAFDILEALVEQGLIYWRLEVPTSGFEPEKHLQHQLERVPSDLAEQSLGELATLVAARDALAGAAGDVERLCQGLDELNSTFQDLTGRQSTRAGGQVYAGRTLVFEDCLRDTELTLGKDFVSALAAPMTLVLQSSTWYTWQIAQRYKQALLTHFDSVCPHGATAVPFLAFRAGFRELFPGPGSSTGIVSDVVAELQQHWQCIIGPGRSSIALRSQDIAAQVNEAFAAPSPGWPGARHHSPDVMLAAAGTDAFLRGDYTIVLGEIHVGLATPSIPLFSKEHAAPETVTALREADLPDAAIAPTWNHALRANLYSTSRHDFDLESGPGLSRRDRSQVLSAAECVVEREGAELMVRSRRTGQQFHILAFLEQHLIAESYSEFNILGATGDHAPRVTIDRLVVRRARWRVDRADLTMIDGKIDRASMFHEVRRWATNLGLPEHCFVVSPTETKPFYVDFGNTLAIENFARYVRKASHFTVSEMLPAPGQSWLPDASGQLYCSELRLCATTPTPWSPS